MGTDRIRADISQNHVRPARMGHSQPLLHGRGRVHWSGHIHARIPNPHPPMNTLTIHDYQGIQIELIRSRSIPELLWIAEAFIENDSLKLGEKLTVRSVHRTKPVITYSIR